MNTPDPQTPAPRRRRPTLARWLALILLVLAAGAGWLGWQSLQQRHSAERAEHEQRVEALESRVDSLRREQRAQAKRLQQADATNRVLRDELLGIGQRAALLEDSVEKLADPAREGVQALRLDEVELLLGQGAQRLQLSGDVEGARRAYTLAAQRLDGVSGPSMLNLRQALAQELAALEALDADPKVAATVALERFGDGLGRLPLATRPAAADATGPWWQRLLGRIVDVRESDRALLDGGDRAAGLAALQLELSLARASAERRDEAGYRAALARVDGWLQALWPDTAARRQQRAQLQALRALPLRLDVPTLGSTLDQLRALREAR